MDIWMVAVAAGAGYIAQHFKNFKKAGGRITSESSLESSYSVKPDSPKQPPDKKWPFRRMEKREYLRQDDSEDKIKVSQGVSGTEVTSTSEFDGEKGIISGNYERSSVFSTSSLFPGFIGSDGVLGDVEGVKVNEGVGDFLHKPPTPRNRSILRSSRTTGRAIRPLSSLESCLMAQLYNEHAEMKEYMSSSLASPSMQTGRPFLVTDGSKVISRAVGDAFVVQNTTAGKKLQTYSDENDAISGVPPLPNIGSLEIRGKHKANTRRDRRRRSRNANTTAIEEHFILQRGSSDATLLLCLGMSFGMISSFMANRREIEKLNRLLKQTESLVQDLQEELEMKDSLIMQELTIEDHKSQQTDCGSFNDGSPQSVSHEHNWEQSTHFNNKEAVIQKAKDDSFSKIEAELEAELEMLELNMTSSTLERRISNLVELDPDFEPDVAQGELRAGMLDGEAIEQASTSQDGSGSTTTPHSANYAVSPRELSLRLHEVLQFQLEERIRELEAEIESKQSQNHKSWKDFSSSEAGDVDEPVVLNLSGEALDAYNEACNEFAKLEESDEEDLCSAMLQHQDVNQTPIYRREEDDGGTSGDEKDFDEDEMEKLLIKHIVEKARQGSPVVLNAQRALFSE